MDEHDRHVVKTALRTLQAADGIGVTREALLDQIDLAAGAPTTNEQREAAFQMLKERGWMTWHMESVWHTTRYTLTERGLTALEGM